MKKKMRGKLVAYGIFMVLPLVVTLLVLPGLPEEIPAHYGFSGEVDRWGSKYTALLFPAITLVFGGVMLLVAWLSGRQEKAGTNNVRITLVSGILCLVLFNVLTYYFLYTSAAQVTDIFAMAVDLGQVLGVFFGILLIVCGNLMPKLRRNSLAGLRTPWSMSSEDAWKRSQRFGGISFMLAGGITVAASLLTKGMVCILVFLGVVLVTAGVDVWYTWRIAKKDSTH